MADLHCGLALTQDSEAPGLDILLDWPMHGVVRMSPHETKPSAMRDTA